MFSLVFARADGVFAFILLRLHKFKDNCGKKQSLSGVPEREDDSEFRREPILGQEDYHRREEESSVSNV